MNPSFLLNPQGDWDSATQYTIAWTPGSAAIGLGYAALPLVRDAGSLWYASGDTQPTVGQHPSQETDVWNLLSVGIVNKTTAPGTANDLTQGYVVGTVWINRTNGDAYICTSNALGAATWQAFAGNV